MEKVISTIIDGYIIFLFFIGLYLFSLFKAGKKSRNKRNAVLMWVAASAVIWIVSYLISLGKVPMVSFWILLAAIAVLAVVFHEKVFPFKTVCQDCGKKMSITEVLSIDEFVCQECFEKRHPETIVVPKEELIRQENERKKATWAGWKANRECVIVFPADSDNNVLMIDNLKLDKVPGKYAGCLGLIKKGESKSAAASRALKTESGLVSESPDYEGRLNFEMPDYNLRCHIFVARDTVGDIKETEEKRPFWTPLKKLKYDLMSVDYPVWLARAVRGQHFEYWARCNKEGKIYDDLLELDVEI